MIPLLALAGYGTAALTAAFIAALHAGRLVVPRPAEWDAPPAVWIHPDLAELAGAVHQAVTVWRALGHELGTVEIGIAPEQAIALVPRPLDRIRERALASAHVEASFLEDDEPELKVPEDDHAVDAPEGVIRHATIYIDPIDLGDKDAARVIAHELGHALGYLHCTARLGRKHAAHRDVGLKIPKAGHLMNPRYDAGGWTTTGLEAAALGDARERRRSRRKEA